MVTTKKLHLPSIVHELLWFLKGGPTKYLQDNGVRIWNEGRRKRRPRARLENVAPLEAKDGRIIDPVQQAIETIETNSKSVESSCRPGTLANLTKWR